MSTTASNRALRVLVVEDGADSLELICELISLIGHEAKGCGECRNRHSKPWKQNLLMCLLTDISLPGMSGIELARKVIKMAAPLKIILSSGYGNSMSRYVEFESTWLSKPLELDQLQKALTTIAMQATA